MSRTNRKKEAPESYEGTAARTRPLSFEEIMLRRKKKLLACNKERATGLKEHSLQDDAKVTLDHLDSNRADKDVKDLKDSIKGNSKKTKEKMPKVKDVDLEDTHKFRFDSHANEKLKSIYMKSGKDKERINEKQSHHRSRDGDKLGTSSTKELEKKQLRHTMERDKQEERDRKSRGEAKRKEHNYADGKNKLEIDYTSLRRHDSGKLRHTEYAVRSGRKDGSKSYFEEPKSKRRRSRSPEYERERGRSVSSSPRGYKRSYHGREHEESTSLSFKDKSRRKHSDGDKQRSGNGGYSSAHFRKHGSGLGGYSPRKRRPEAVRTPSPTIPSPERKTAKWDQPPAETKNSGFGVMPANFQSPAVKIQEPPLSVPVTPTTKIPQHASSADIATIVMSASIDSVQLTQATRPRRRLFVENLPASASEKTVVDLLNNLLVSSGVNHIKGSSPCISCILNKEKSQAVVEFLTPQDATAALSFDGRSISGSVLKIRRPKDFVEAATGVLEKPKEDVRVVADLVKDSPHKIFIGGISEVISSSMLMEIVGAFGTLKAYHFEFNKEVNGPCAFLEYADHSITSKACAGLNGMTLGGCILTVVQALPEAAVEEENAEIAPCYAIPAHVKSLLAPSTKVLQLKNVFDREEFLLLSESDMEEIIEDIRLECTRFGTVKAVNIIRYNSNPGTSTETFEAYPNGYTVETESRMECPSNDSKQYVNILPQKATERPGDIRNDIEDTQNNKEMPLKDIEESVFCRIDGAALSKEAPQVDGVLVKQPMETEKDVMIEEEDTGAEIGLFSDTPKALEDNAEMEQDAALNSTSAQKANLTREGVAALIENTNQRTCTADEADASKEDGERMSMEITSTNPAVTHNKGTGDVKDDQKDFDLSVFEPGSVFVEFVRKEATCMAAHCLHGRTYGERIVTAGFYPHDLYLARFHR